MKERESWKPKPDELNRFYNVYVDESSHTKFKYLVIGALAIPYTHVARFNEDMFAARDGTKTPRYKPDGELKVLKWEDCNDYTLDACINTVNAVIGFKRKHNMPAVQDMRLNCLAVDTEARPQRVIGDGDREVGYEKELYFLSGLCISNKFRDGLFRVYCDQRNSRLGLDELRGMMNNGAAKHDHRHDFPFRHISFSSPKASLPLQVLDMFMGALAYRLNRHYEAKDANSAKKTLTEHIWKVCNNRDPFVHYPRGTKYFMNWIHRPGASGNKKKPFQNEPFEE